MKTFRTAFFTAVLGLSFIFNGITAVNANSDSAQIVPETKQVSKKVYHKGHHATKKSYKYGKKTTKKVYRTGNRWGHKAGRKTKHFVMGPSRRNQ